MNAREFGIRLTQFRQRARLSIAEVAQRTGVHYTQISRYEKGQILPSLEPATRLAKVFGVSLDELVTGTEPPPPPTFQNERLLERMRDLDRLPPERQEIALRVVDTVIAGHELEDLSRRLRSS